MALLKTLGGWFRAKDRVASDKIESSNLVEFAKNDLEDMQKDYTAVQENIGHIKARVSQLNGDIKDINDQITTNTNKATQLVAKATPEAENLAKQICASIEALEARLKINSEAVAQQEKLLAQQEDTKTALEDHLQECNNELEIMKTQQDVTSGNQTLVHVNAGSSGSAVEKFKERRRKLDEKLAFSSAMVEQSQDHATSLAEKADKVLGTSKGSALFEKLKADKKTA
jgi:phage shock protein A